MIPQKFRTGKTEFIERIDSQTWDSLKQNDPRLKLIPRRWLEGVQRGYSVDVP